MRSESRTYVDQASSSQVEIQRHLADLPPQYDPDEWTPGDKSVSKKDNVAHSEASSVHQSSSTAQTDGESHQDDSAYSKVDMGFKTIATTYPPSDKDKKNAKTAEKTEGTKTENVEKEDSQEEKLLSKMDSKKVAQIQAQMVAAVRAKEEQSAEAGCRDFCLEAFPLGVPDSNRCVDYGVHTPILDRSMCEEAARQANATEGLPNANPPAPFVVRTDYADYYPAGCFKLHGHGAYFYNEAGNYPKWPMGIPVCQRQKFANGTTGTNAGCPTGFARIMNEDACERAAGCQGFCINEADFQFGVNASVPSTDTRMPDASFYNLKPSGCFIHPIDNCSYFNVPQAAEPTGPLTGIPMCEWVEHVSMDDPATSPL